MIRKILKMANYIMPKKNNFIVLTPHSNCAIDNYDIFNWNADNVLCLMHFMLESNLFFGYTIYLVYYNNEKYNSYLEYLKKFKDIKVILVKDNSIRFILGFLKSRIIITTTTYRTYSYKTNRQFCICLGYYSPFKNDFEYIQNMTNSEQQAYFTKINHLFDYHITTSDFSSRIIASDFLLKFNKFLPLGFPRNDIFYRTNEEYRDKILKYLRLNYDIIAPQIIIYTPTFRDYESADKGTRSIFGLFNNKQLEQLNKILENKNIVIIAKLHPLQEASIIEQSQYNRIIIYSDLANKLTTNLYQLLSISNGLITDYTSTCFDYLHCEKPIIYYCYDYDQYVRIRGLSITPLEAICGGKIVYNPTQLIDGIVDIAKNCDNYKEKRSYINKLVNLYHDGQSTRRVAMFIKSLTK